MYMYIHIYLSIDRSIDRSIDLFIYLSIYIGVCKYVYKGVLALDDGYPAGAPPEQLGDSPLAQRTTVGKPRKYEHTS